MPRLLPFKKAFNRRRLATLLLALWKLFRHRDTPRAAKWVAVAVLAYAISPIDLIPDFIPVLGQLDDLIIVPLGIALAVRLTPPHLWQARLQEAERSTESLPAMKWGIAIVVAAWLVVAGLLLWWLLANR